MSVSAARSAPSGNGGGAVSGRTARNPAETAGLTGATQAPGGAGAGALSGRPSAAAHASVALRTARRMAERGDGAFEAGKRA